MLLTWIARIIQRCKHLHPLRTMVAGKSAALELRLISELRGAKSVLQGPPRWKVQFSKVFAPSRDQLTLGRGSPNIARPQLSDPLPPGLRPERCNRAAPSLGWGIIFEGGNVDYQGGKLSGVWAMTDVKKFFLDAFHHLGSSRGLPVVDVRFYPYAGLRHTIRLRSGQVYVRLSDICKNSPPEVMRALAFVLVARLLGKKIPPVHDRTYREYSLTPEVMRSSDIARRGRGRKMISSARGQFLRSRQNVRETNRR